MQQDRVVAAFDARTLRVLLTSLVFFGALAIIYLARRMFLTLLFAIFFAYLLEPAVDRVQRWLGRTRLQAIAVVYVLGLVIVAGTIVVALPKLQEEVRYAATAVPNLAKRVGNGNIAYDVGRQQGWSYETRAEVSRFIAAHRADLEGAVKSAGARAADVGSYAGYVVLIPIFAFFFLKDKSCLSDLTLNLITDPQRREFVDTIFGQLDHMLAKYIRAQLLLAGLAMVAYTVFLSIAQFPYSLVVGVVAGILEFLPFLGPAIAAVMIVGVAVFTGYSHWIALLVFIGAWRLTQDYVNTPYFMSEGLELHPLAAIFGILVGGEVFGIPGIFLSIPVIAGLRIVWHNWQDESVRRHRPARVARTTRPARNRI